MPHQGAAAKHDIKTGKANATSSAAATPETCTERQPDPISPYGGEFANAFCGLYEWDKWANPNYLDKLLISPEVKPKDLRYVSDSRID